MRTFRKILYSGVPLCYVISEGTPPLRNTSSEAGALPSEERIENDLDWNFLSQKFSVDQCPPESANGRPSPPISVRVRQCPSMSVRVQCPLMSQKTRPLSHRGGGGGGVTSVYVRLSHRIQKGQDRTGHRRT